MKQNKLKSFTKLNDYNTKSNSHTGTVDWENNSESRLRSNSFYNR